MYLAFFGLAEKPFAITPDPRYLYLSARHADALAHLVYGINEAGGFIQLTGEVGTGKTTTIRSLLAQAPKNAEIALILNPRLSAAEFLRSLCEELGLGAADRDDDTKELVDLLNRYLLRAHAAARRVVLIVDEAQNLAPEVLEQIRLLTNLETETQKLLQIILIGQPELRRLLAREDLRQLAQRITARFHLDPLSREETAAYVRHRLRVAGATAEIFSRAALREIHRISGGVPRVINIVSDRALLGAYTEDSHTVTAALVRRAGAEVFGRHDAPPWVPFAVATAALALLSGSALLMWRYAPAHLVPGTGSRPAIVAHATVAKPVAPPAPPEAPTGAPALQVPPPAPAGAASPPLAQWLADHRDQTDADTAFATLMSLWKKPHTNGSDGCAQAAAAGLQCLTERGSLAQLRLLNRPAILMLSDEKGMPYQIVMRELGPDDALLQAGQATLTVGIAELTRSWFGDFVLLWQPESGSVRDLHAGMRGTEVRHLRAELERWRGAGTADAAVPSPVDRYDESLIQMVEQFQRANRLAVDGVAGIETQIALDSALTRPGTPVLQARPTPQTSTRGS